MDHGVGINTVIYFTTTILHYTGSSTSLSVQQAVYVGLTNFVLTIVAILCMDWLGRRVILVSGTVVATCAPIGLGFYFLSRASHRPMPGSGCWA